MRSDRVTHGPERAPHRALLSATGVLPEDLGRKPLIGVATSFSDVVPGHIGMRRLEGALEKGIHAGGGLSFIFGVPAICDGIAMGHAGMHYSLPSRELIADTIETMVQAHAFDGIVLLTNCDKITPGMLMGAARVDIPAIVVTAGPMLGGWHRMIRRSLVRDTFEAVGLCLAGKISDRELQSTELAACPGAGSCQGVYTANTMACAAEAMGMTWPGCASALAVSAEKERIAYRSGQQIVKLTKKNITVRQIITRAALENASMVCMAMGNYDVETKLTFMQRFSPHHIVASPTYLVRMATVCKLKGIDPKKAFPRIKAISIAAEPYPIEWAIRMQEFWNCPIIDCYGCTQSAGLIGFSCPQGLIRDGGRGSIHLAEAYIYVEILNPESDEPVDYGEEGEVTITLLPRQGTPVVRFRMRDKVRIFPASECNCGSSFDYLEAGNVGRYDDMIKIKVCNIWPQSVDDVVFAYSEIEEYNGIGWVDEKGSEKVKVRVEYKADVTDPDLKEKIAKELREKIRSRTQVSMGIEEVPHGTLEKALFKSRRWKDNRKEGLREIVSK